VATNTIRGERTGAYQVYGDYPDYFKIDRWSTNKGRLINEIDMLQERKVCDIGERVEEVMFAKGENPIGQYLKINGVYFQVVGVIHAETRINIGGGKKEETIIIPYTTMQKAYNFGNVVYFFSVTAQKGTKVSDLEDKLKVLLKARHKVAPEDLQAIGSFNIEKEFVKFSALFPGNTGFDLDRRNRDTSGRSNRSKQHHAGDHQGAYTGNWNSAGHWRHSCNRY